MTQADEIFRQSGRLDMAWNLLFESRAIDVLHYVTPNTLTVLNYHRVTDLNTPDFDTFLPNVSATPHAFAEQMDYVSRHFNVVTMAELVAWLRKEHSLPRHPLLITFDDGYYDNYSEAYPILKARNLPATIFLATNQIGTSKPFFWDLVAYCFHHTNRNSADLPHAGTQVWNTENRDAVMLAWIDRLKSLPSDEIWKIVKRLPEQLGVAMPDDAFNGLYMTWDHVREIASEDIDIGAHTMSHPRLTLLPREQVREELGGSKRRIEEEIARPVLVFAYPFGLSADFSPEIEAVAVKVGFEAAFTLRSGPCSLLEARRAPTAIRRIFVSHKDSLPRFAAKISGLQRLLGRP